LGTLGMASPFGLGLASSLGLASMGLGLGLAPGLRAPLLGLALLVSRACNNLHRTDHPALGRATLGGQILTARVVLGRIRDAARRQSRLDAVASGEIRRCGSRALSLRSGGGFL
jgi:hypothetical protein